MEAAGMIAIAGTGIVGGSEIEVVGGIASGTAAAALAVEIAEKATDGGTPCCARHESKRANTCAGTTV